MPATNAVVAIYENRPFAEQGLDDLRRAGVRLERLSIAGPGYHSQETRGRERSFVIGGLAAVGRGLFHIGVPKESIGDYEAAIREHRFLLIAHGSTDQAVRASEIIRTGCPFGGFRSRSGASASAGLKIPRRSCGLVRRQRPSPCIGLINEELWIKNALDYSRRSAGDVGAGDGDQLHVLRVHPDFARTGDCGHSHSFSPEPAPEFQER